MISRIWHYFADHIDWPLLTAVLLLAGAGLIILFSAAGSEGGEKVYAQVRNLGLALAVMWIVANIPPQHLMRLALPYLLRFLAERESEPGALKTDDAGRGAGRAAG